MKLAMFLAALFAISAIAADKTTIEFQLMGTETSKKGSVKKIVLSSLNKKLKAVELPGFPTVITLGKDDKPYWLKMIRQLVNANSMLGRNIEIVMERGYLGEFPAMCYRGKTAEVRDVIEGLMGSVFHEDQGIQAVRYGTKKFITYTDEFFETNKERREEQEQNNAEEVALWDNYDTKSDTVLVMSDYGPQGDGTELTATSIVRCNEAN